MQGVSPPAAAQPTGVQTSPGPDRQAPSSSGQALPSAASAHDLEAFRRESATLAHTISDAAAPMFGVRRNVCGGFRVQANESSLMHESLSSKPVWVVTVSARVLMSAAQSPHTETVVTHHVKAQGRVPQCLRSIDPQCIPASKP